VLDAALTRGPADRYQSVAKFAADVAAVMGTTLEGAPLPATRADADGKTELMDAPPPRAPARKRSGSATKVMAPTKKRSLVPIFLGAIVVLGGGAAAAKMLMFGPKADGSAVRQDTVNHQVTNKVDSMGLSRNITQSTNPRTGDHRVTKRPRQDSTAGTPPGSRPEPDAPALTAALGALLDKIDDLSGDVLVDSGRAIFNAARSSAVKAEAAYTLAQVYVIKVRDLQKAHDWIANAVQLAPTTRKYTDLLSAVNNDMRRP
jgi:hypothetical protein